MRVDYAYMLLILLLPLLPAFLLFRFLPSSSAVVDGPFKGFNIKLGGAFGGYIVAVFLSWYIASSLLAPTWSDNWNVVARLQFVGATGAKPSPTEAFVLVHPPTPDIDSNGTLQLMVPIPRVHNSGAELQRLIVAYDGYETVNVPLDPDQRHVATYGGTDYQVKYDEKNHQITICQPIVLTRAAQ